MSIADWCILVAALLPLLALAPAKALGRGDYDNANPRAEQFYREGLRARAWGAHLNGFEAFPFFAAAVLLAEMRHSPQWIVDALSVSYTVARIGYVAAYLLDWASLRSGLWAIALIFNIALMITPALRPWW
jgi:uncharacterized MAPEG superfamily protein